MNLNGSRNIETWNENALRVVTVKALGNGVPVRTAFPGALSEWLDGCLLDRETFWARLHASWNGLGTESEPIQLPSFLAPKSFQYLRPLHSTLLILMGVCHKQILGQSLSGGLALGSFSHLSLVFRSL